MVAKNKNWRVIVAALLLLFAVGTVIAVLANRTPDGEPDNLVSSIDRILSPKSDSGDEDESTGEVASSDAGDLTATDAGQGGSTTKRTVPKVTDKPTPPAAGPSAEQLWQQYLAETKAVVDGNKPNLAAVIAQVTQALSTGDQATLTALLAPDEGSQSTYLAELASKYPTITSSAPAGNVNIFTSGGATIYFGYSLVVWTDAGITSQHTIPIMLRFVDDEWHLSTLGDTGSDLQFVQSVTL